jgi:hypothetical protein
MSESQSQQRDVRVGCQLQRNFDVPAEGDTIKLGTSANDVGADWMQVIDVIANRLGTDTPIYRLHVRL